MSWYNTEGAYASHILYTRISYIRNPASIGFGNKANQAELLPLLSKVNSILNSNGFRKEIFGESSQTELYSLYEKQFVQKELLRSSAEKSIYLNEPCNLIISLGGKNFFNVSSLLSGLSVNEALKAAGCAEELLDKEIEFAYSDDLGYLSPVPRDVGSGIEFSCALFLPSAQDKENENYFSQIALDSHASLSPLIQGCGSSSLYVLKFRPQGKMSEQSSALLFEMIAKKTINAEKEFSRIKFTPLSKIIIEDAWRTFGILLYARSIEASELFNLIRTLRLCSIIESEAEKPPVSILKINRLIAECQNYSIISSEKCKNEDDIALSRAKAVKEILQKDCSEPLTREHKGVKDNND